MAHIVPASTFVEAVLKPALELRILGRRGLGPDDDPGLQGLVAQPKRFALLAYLAMEGRNGFVSRDLLLGAFWPESSLDKARNSLSQALFALRKALGSEAVVSRGAEEVGLDGSIVWCDAVAFERALESGDPARALDLYGGDLLPGLYLSGAPAFEQWLDGERTRLRQRAVVAASDLADAAMVDNPLAAVHQLRRAVEWAPFEEPVVRRLIRLLDALGDRAGALREYEALRQRLTTELRAEPSPETQAVLDEVRSREQAAVLREPAPGTSRVLPPHPEPRPSRRRRALAGIGATAAALAALGGAAGLFRATGRPASGPAADRVLVTGFANRTGEPSLDPFGLMAGDWIVQGLSRSGMVRVVPISTVLGEESLSRADAATESGASALQVAREIGAGFMVTGTFYIRRDSLVVQARIHRVPSGEVVAAVADVTGPRDRFAETVDEVRGRVMGALGTLTDPRLASWESPGDHPPSLESYRLFAAGFDRFLRANQVRGRGGPTGEEHERLTREAATQFVDASGPDSTFIAPLLWAAFALLNVGDLEPLDTLLTALEARPDLSPWDRALLAVQRAMQRGDDEEQYHRAKRLVELAPDSEWHYVLASSAYRTRRYREAIAGFERVDPDRGWIRDFPSFWHLRINTRHVLGDHRRELEDFRQLRARFPADGDLPRIEFWALAGAGRSADLLARVREILAAGDHERAGGLVRVVHELNAHGDGVTARQVAEKALALFERLDGPSAEASRARLLDVLGRHDEAAATWERLAAASPGWLEARARVGLQAARHGDRASAAAVDAWLAAHQTPFGIDGGSLIWRARIAARLGDRDRAVGFVREAVARGFHNAALVLHSLDGLESLRGYPPFEAVIGPRD